MPKPPDFSDDAQRQASVAAVLREYGNVVGTQQAENIVFHVLVAARSAELNKYTKEEQSDG
ncbi:MAG: hypothetical protein AAFR98_11945 [Pseudomonadota bacterium]